jgi:hypothetical protein
MPCLQHLHKCEQGMAAFSHLVGPACPGLQHLKLQGGGIYAVIEPTLFSGLSACPSLTSLDLDHVQLSPAAAEQISLLPIHAPNITSLALDGMGMVAAPYLGALSPQLTSLVWHHLDLSPAAAAALTQCVHLVTVEGTGSYPSERAWLDALLQLPALKHVTLNDIDMGQLTPDHDAGAGLALPRVQCSWESLTIEEDDMMHVEDVPWLPLQGLQKLCLRGLIFVSRAPGADARAAVERAVSALLPLAQQGRLQWTGEGGHPDILVYGLQQWAGALAGLAPLARYLPPVDMVIYTQAVSGAQLAQLVRSLAGVQLSSLLINYTTPINGFWGALNQSSTAVQVLRLRAHSEGQWDVTDLSLFLATCPHPLWSPGIFLTLLRT